MNLYFVLTVYKHSGNCNNINDKYAKLCAPDVVKDMNIKAFNLISRNNETRCVFWHETCTCQCRLDASIFHDNQRWNNDKSRCKYKELIDVMMDFFGILLHVNANVINHVMLKNI